MVCVPVWYASKGVPSVSCRLCLVSRRGCSFKVLDFGIERWPTIVASSASLERRAEGAAAKRKGTPQVPKEDVSVIGTQGSISTAPTRARKPAKPRGAPIETLTVASPSTTSPSTVAGPSSSLVIPVTGASSSLVEGRVHGVFLEPLDSFVAAVSNPDVDGLMLGSQLVDLEAIRHREQGDSFFITSTLRERRRFMGKLARRLRRRIRELGADTTDEESSDFEDDDDEDWTEGKGGRSEEQDDGESGQGVSVGR